jgi:hypothetical protein
MPSAWGRFEPTRWDWLTLAGAVGFFALGLTVTLKVVPMLPISELKEFMSERGRLVPSPPDVPRPAPPPTARPPRPLLDEQLHGVAAEFADEEEFLEATRRARAAGWAHVETYTPYPVKELDEALGLRRSLLAPLVFAGGVGLAASVYFMQWYSAAVSYPWRIAGRPPNSWPAFAIPTFESLVLGAVLTGVGAMIALNRLPRLHHPIFGAPAFERATRDRFFLVLERAGPAFDRAGARRFLEAQRPLRVCEVSE